MVRILAVLLLSGLPLLAQQGTQPKVRMLLTLTPGFLTAQRTTTYGLGGELELYTQGKISLRGDAYALLGKSTQGGLRQNYQGFLGIVYNFDRIGGLAPFAGFQPGFGFGQVDTPATDVLRLYPALSPVFGAHYFADTFFHFTIHVRYVFGEMYYQQTGAVYLSELRAGFGLGIFF